MSALAANKSFLGSKLQSSSKAGNTTRQGTVKTQALFGKLKGADKKEVDRFKKSQVKDAKRLLPFDEKLKKTAPKRTFNMDAARNKPREGGFGQGKPFQKQKIGPKMEGTPITSQIDPLLFVGGLIGFTIVTVGGLIANS